MVAVAILLLGTVLPALSGVLLWIGRQNPARMWAAEQLARGRFFVHSVSASLLDGVSAGAVDGAVWRVRRLGGAAGDRLRAVDLTRAERRRCGFGSMLGDTLSASMFLALGVAFVVEAFDRFRVNPIVSTIVVAARRRASLPANDQEQLLPALVSSAEWDWPRVIVVLLYRRRGFLAAWIAGMASGWMTTVMALRSLEDQDLARLSNFLVMIVVVIAAAGAWGAGRRLLQKPGALTIRALSSPFRLHQIVERREPAKGLEVHLAMDDRAHRQPAGKRVAQKLDGLLALPKDRRE